MHTNHFEQHECIQIAKVGFVCHMHHKGWPRYTSTHCINVSSKADWGTVLIFLFPILSVTFIDGLLSIKVYMLLGFEVVDKLLVSIGRCTSMSFSNH